MLGNTTGTARFAAPAAVLPDCSIGESSGHPMKHITCIDDLRQLARRRVPRAFFDYADSGSYNEETLRANRADLEAIKLRQRILVDVSSRSLATTIVGQKVAAPFALAPIGLCGMQHGDGEILSARAANEAGIPFTLSTMSICSIEDVAEATGKPFWFQLYVIKDRGFSKDVLARASAAKCSALVLTVDLQVLGQRHRDIKNGMTMPPEIRLKNIIDAEIEYQKTAKNAGDDCGCEVKLDIPGMPQTKTPVIPAAPKKK